MDHFYMVVIHPLVGRSAPITNRPSLKCTFELFPSHTETPANLYSSATSALRATHSLTILGEWISLHSVAINWRSYLVCGQSIADFAF